VEVASFVGRTGELAEIQQLLEATRHVTITGAGGVGKTRTALEVARHLHDRFPDGIWLVRLSELRDGALLAHTIARELELQDQTIRPMIDVLVDHLAERRSLLILDTCEHLLDTCALLVPALLKAAPELHVITTSRQPLHAQGENAFAIAPLAVPGEDVPAAGTRDCDAVRLFADRARAAAPAFELTEGDLTMVARLCRLLDGLPLALELAAAQLRTMRLEEVAMRLDDRFAVLNQASPSVPLRHETLRAAIGWSHELCTPQERLLWVRASVFAGSFTLEAARQVCAGEPIDVADVPEILAALVDKSIVLREGSRYRLLDTIREYGAYWLAELGEEHPMWLRHRDHYLTMARQAFPQWTRSGQVIWYRRIADDHTEIRVALETCLAEADPAALEMAGALWFFWFSCGHQREGRSYLERALALPTTQADPFRTRALWAHGCVVLAQGDLAATDRSIDACRIVGTPEAELAADYLEGTSCSIRARPDEALRLLLPLSPVPERGGIDEAVWMLRQTALAFTRIVRGELGEAAGLAQAIRAEGSRRGECKFTSFGHYIQALADLGLGDLEGSLRHAREALDGNRRLGDSWGMALALDALAMATAASGDPGRGALFLGIGESLWRRTYGRAQFGSPELTAARKGCEAQIRAAIGDAATDAALATGMRTDPVEALA